MRCPTCGFAIDQPNLAQCPNCGNALPAPAGQMEHTSQGAQGPTPPEYQPNLSYAPYPPSLNYPGGYGQPYGQPAPPSYPYPGAPGYPPAGYPQPLLAPLPVRKRRTGLIVGIVAAVVVVLAACTGGTIFAIRAIHLPSQTAVPRETPHPIYNNSFTTSNDAGWSYDQHCFIKSDGYHVANNYMCFAPIGNWSDVDIQVQVKQVSGSAQDPMGIVFRLIKQSETSYDYYSFQITSFGRWAFVKCVASTDSCVPLVGYKFDGAIHSGVGASNLLEVYAKGSHIYAFINGTMVGSLDDSTYTTGRVGLICGAYREFTECVFTNFAVGELD